VESFASDLSQRFNSSDVTLPNGVTPSYAVTIVTDFVREI
jgi:hypothetical protein